MAAKAQKNTSYLQVCASLRRNLDRYVDEKGCLLSELALCKHLSASRGSVRKALDELRSGGYITTVKRRNYLKSSARRPEIGILMDCYKSAPYLPETSIFVALLSEMERSGFHGRILVPSDARNIPALLEQYNLKGLVWFDPPEISYPAIAEMISADKLKICCVFSHGDLPEGSPIRSNFVSMDRVCLGKRRADYFLSKGHQKVVCISPADSTYDSFISEMASHGAKQLLRWRLDQPAQVVDSLRQLIEEEQISAIASVGGGRLESMFEVLAGIKNIRDLDLDIVLPDTALARRLMVAHPEVGVLRRVDFNMSSYGTEGMKMLIRQIQEGRDQTPILVKPSFADTPKHVIPLKNTGNGLENTDCLGWQDSGQGVYTDVRTPQTRR
jgi:DNA-binding LacI/PurR family transcriptional regulator